MLIHLIVHVVHTDDTRDVIVMRAGRQRILGLLGSAQDTPRCRSVVFVGMRVSPQTLWNEPARAMGLLPLDNEQLEGHKQDYASCGVGVRLLVQKVIRIYLQIERHEALHGEQSARELHIWSLATSQPVAVHDLGHPERRIEEKDGPRFVKKHVLENDGCEARHVEDDVEPGETLALVLLVIHLLLGELRSPANDEKARLKSETANEVPEGWQTQILHEFTISVNRELEIDSKEKEVPDEV